MGLCSFLVNLCHCGRTSTPSRISGDLYHVVSCGDRKKDIELEAVDRQDFLKTLAKTCQKAEFQRHAYS